MTRSEYCEAQNFMLSEGLDHRFTMNAKYKNLFQNFKIKKLSSSTSETAKTTLESPNGWFNGVALYDIIYFGVFLLDLLLSKICPGV